MNLKFVTENQLLLFGSIMFFVIGWFFKWLIQKTLDAKFKRMADISLENRKEREYDQYLSLRGQEVTNDCLHELIYCAINGTHNGGLQKANDELEAYRSLLADNITEKAARYTGKILK